MATQKVSVCVYGPNWTTTKNLLPGFKIIRTNDAIDRLTMQSGHLLLSLSSEPIKQIERNGKKKKTNQTKLIIRQQTNKTKKKQAKKDLVWDDKDDIFKQDIYDDD